jgi:hypothetical protein
MATAASPARPMLRGDTLDLLIAAALLAAIHRTPEDGESVSVVVETELPDSTEFQICRALALSGRGDARLAVEQMNKRMQDNPDDEAAKVVLAVAMRLAGDANWRFSIDNVLATSVDQEIRETACNVLDCLQAFRQGRPS